MKIRTYLLVFALAIILPMIAFSAIAVWAFDRQQRALVERTGVETARAMVNAVDRELNAAVTTRCPRGGRAWHPARAGCRRACAAIAARAAREA